MSLWLGMLLLALAGIPHCAFMCGAPCAAVLARRPGNAFVSFQLGRIVGYSAVGGLLAAGVGQLVAAGRWSMALMPLWVAWHGLALAWGLFLVARGQQPGFAWAGAQPAPAKLRWPWVAGAAWVAWPCGLLQSALLMASLANDAWQGAALMAGFAALSGLGLGFAPWLARWLGSLGMRQESTLRAAGAVLALGSLWAMADRSGFLAWCLA